MTLSNHQLSRRQFNKALAIISMAGVFSFPLKAFADEEHTADGLFHLNQNGKINIYSGAACLNPYGFDDAKDIIQETLGCLETDIIFNVGNNPKQLPAMLSQHCNHLSFSTKRTNHKTALILKSELISRIGIMVDPDDCSFQLRNGMIKCSGRKYPLKNILNVTNNVVEVGAVSKSTIEIAQSIKEDGLTIMVGEVI